MSLSVVEYAPISACGEVSAEEVDLDILGFLPSPFFSNGNNQNEQDTYTSRLVFATVMSLLPSCKSLPLIYPRHVIRKSESLPPRPAHNQLCRKPSYHPVLPVGLHGNSHIYPTPTHTHVRPFERNKNKNKKPLPRLTGLGCHVDHLLFDIPSVHTFSTNPGANTPIGLDGGPGRVGLPTATNAS